MDVSESCDIFRQSMNKEKISFKGQYTVEKLSSIDLWVSHHLLRDENNDMTCIVWVVSYMWDDFERFGTNLSIDGIDSSLYDAKAFCYIAPVVKNRINKMCVVCEGFAIIETNQGYHVILN